MKIQSSMEYRISCVADAASGNGNLVHTTQMPEIRKSCYGLIRQRGYESVAKKEFRVPNYRMMKFKLYLLHSRLGKLLRRMKHIIR